MKRLLLALLLATAAFAEDATTKLIQLKYVDPDLLRNLVAPFGVVVNVDKWNRAMTISGPAAKVEAATAIIAKLDVAPKNIELIVYFVTGSNQPETTGVAAPADIRDVITQLKSTFTYKDYRMLDTLTLRTRAGSNAETSGILGPGASPRRTTFSIRNASVSEDGSTIRIDRMHAGLIVPVTHRVANVKGVQTNVETKVEYLNSGIDQDVDVKAGQKVVVGRSSLEGPEKALFLILTARVAD